MATGGLVREVISPMNTTKRLILQVGLLAWLLAVLLSGCAVYEGDDHDHHRGEWREHHGDEWRESNGDHHD